MIEDIGKAAGEIWAFLGQQSGPVPMSAIKKGVELPSMLLMTGIGWLAREGKLSMEMSEKSNSYRISLRG